MSAEERKDRAPGEPPRPDQPADAPDVMPPHPLPPPGPDESLDGNNATIHHPDPHAKDHPAWTDHKGRGPYVTGNT